MGRRVNFNSARIEPFTPFVADVVSKWLLLVLKPNHYKSLWRLLGKIVWLGRPAASVGSFLASPRLWLNQGPFWSSRTPFVVVRSFWRPLLPLSGAGSPTLFLLHLLSGFFRMRPLIPISQAAMWLACGHPGAL